MPCPTLMRRFYPGRAPLVALLKFPPQMRRLSFFRFMEDFEAFGQLRQAPVASDEAAAPLAAPRRKRSRWLRNITLAVLGYTLLSITTTVQPIAVPFTGIRLSAPFPGG